VTIPGCSAASATLVVSGSPTTPAFTDLVAMDLDLVQYESEGGGPCIEAYDTCAAVGLESTETEDRWPEFTAAAMHLANSAAFHKLETMAGNLQNALESRDVIGQAKGILMRGRGITADAAFELLNERSQATNVNLRDVADEVCFVGDLPPLNSQ
jgi:hypothetical protein